MPSVDRMQHMSWDESREDGAGHHPATYDTGHWRSVLNAPQYTQRLALLILVNLYVRFSKVCQIIARVKGF